jgi:hypothetical protein
MGEHLLVAVADAKAVFLFRQKSGGPIRLRP